MKCKRVAFVVLTGLWLAVPPGVGQDSLSEMLNRLTGEQFDEPVLYAIEGNRSDPRIVPALEAAFGRRSAKREKQEVAMTLLRLGDKSAEYFDFLAQYAREAVEDRSPSFIYFDANGRSVRGRFSTAFETWCALNGKEPKSVAAVQIEVYPQDVQFLARSEDQRGAELLRKGLNSPHPYVVAFCVEGLGRLQDVAAIPFIAKECERLEQDARIAVAMALPWYSSPEAYQLMERLVPDRKYRDFLANGVQRLRLIELKRTLNRNGVAAQK
jgi:hypothetical protein